MLSVHVADTFPLRAAADAQRRSQQGHTRGKLVVTADPDVVDFGGRYCFVRPDTEDLTRSERHEADRVTMDM